MKTAVIVGAAGQDGRLLNQFLSACGYSVIGIENDSRVDITSPAQVLQLVAAVRPDEIYHLAAVHHAAQEKPINDVALFRLFYEVNFFSLINFLEAIRVGSSKTRLFYAASSLVFGDDAGWCTEETPFRPRSVYAMTKADGVLACRRYREDYGVFASAGILYHHESRFRATKFLSKKVIRAALAISRGSKERLTLGGVQDRVDFGYAPEYVEAMHAVLLASAADDFVIATGTCITVQEFVAHAFHELGLDWRAHVDVSDVVSVGRTNCGNPSKLTRVTGWRATTTAQDVVRRLIRD